MTKPAMHTYDGYKITVRDSGVDVFDPRNPRDPKLYHASSLYRAIRWVDAYHNGEQWAVDARLLPKDA